MCGGLRYRSRAVSFVLLTWQWTLSITNNYIATHRDPGMRALYRDYIAMFRAAGVPSRGFPFLHFGSTGFPSPYGSFSVLEFTGQVRGEPIVHGWLDVCVAASRLARRLNFELPQTRRPV